MQKHETKCERETSCRVPWMRTFLDGAVARFTLGEHLQIFPFPAALELYVESEMIEVTKTCYELMHHSYVHSLPCYL